MRKAQIAELILSLFTSRDRAASTVGDLMENALGHGGWWFWSGVSRTALSLFWSSFSAEPYFVAGIAIRGLMLNLTLYWPCSSAWSFSVFFSYSSWARILGLHQR
jgi:hypothetical protein